LRKGSSEDDVLMIVLNLTPRVFEYKIGVNEGTNWEVILNSDDEKYGGSGVKAEIVDEEDDEWMFRPNAIILNLPALSGVVLKQKAVVKSKKKSIASKISKPKSAPKLENKEISAVKKKVQPKTSPKEIKVENPKPKVSRLKKAITEAAPDLKKSTKKK